MRKPLALGLIILFFFLGIQPVQAGTFYLHEHPSYWWYVVDDPAFSAIIPSGADNYIERSIFGMEHLLMTFQKGTITMEVIYQPVQTSSQYATARRTVQTGGKEPPILSNEITTSNNLKAHFYAYQGTCQRQTGDAAIRVLPKGRHVVYLTLFLEADQYQGDLREYWIRAVNGFEWN